MENLNGVKEIFCLDGRMIGRKIGGGERALKNKVKVFVDFVVIFILSCVGLIFASFVAFSKSFDVAVNQSISWPSEQFTLYFITEENIEVNFVNIMIVSVCISVIVSILLGILRNVTSKYLMKKGMN